MHAQDFVASVGGLWAPASSCHCLHTCMIVRTGNASSLEARIVGIERELNRDFRLKYLQDPADGLTVESKPGMAPSCGLFHNGALSFILWQNHIHFAYKHAKILLTSTKICIFHFAWYSWPSQSPLYFLTFYRDKCEIMISLPLTSALRNTAAHM